MALKIIRQHAHGAGRPAHLLEHAAQLRVQHGVRRDACWSALPSSLSVLVSVPRVVASVWLSSLIAFCRSSPMPLSGIPSIFLTMLRRLASIASIWPGWVGICTGFCDQSSVTGGASGKKSTATNNDPLIMLPVRNCARSPRATRASITLLWSAAVGVDGSGPPS